MINRPAGRYLSRGERAQFVVNNFAAYLTGRVLDVGCGEGFLRRHIPAYVGCDIAGLEDVTVNLDSGFLPFQNGSFCTAVCIDVLEHVEPLGHIFEDLFRVAQENVIVSLPNVYALGYRLKFLQGKVIAKEYSLEPRNRHKWLPSYSETRHFIRRHLPEDWRIRWEFGYYPHAWWRSGPAYGFLADRYPNLFATTYWAHFYRDPK